MPGQEGFLYVETLQVFVMAHKTHGMSKYICFSIICWVRCALNGELVLCVSEVQASFIIYRGGQLWAHVFSSCPEGALQLRLYFR